MSTLCWLTLLPALAQAPVEVGPTGAPPADPAPAAPTPDADPAAVETPVEAAPPRPWTTPEDPALRTADGLPIVGPWPDDHTPAVPVHRAWPLIDVRTGDVLQAGHPYGMTQGVIGPLPVPEVVFEREPEPMGPLPEPVAEPVVAPRPQPIAQEKTPDPATPRTGWSLPTPPPRSPVLALFWLGIGVFSALFARSSPSLVASLHGGGAVPSLVRAAGQAARVLAVVAGALVLLYALPPGARTLVPWLLLGLALSAGLAAWGLFRDVIALVVLGLERRLLPGRQVRVDDVAGEIVSISPRAVTLTSRSGGHVSVPNWRFIAGTVHLDDDPRVLTEVRLHVPADAPRDHVHRVLEELVLRSPYAVARGRPGVRPDPDDPTAWFVEARLLDARWARAFEHTLVELAAERLQP